MNFQTKHTYKEALEKLNTLQSNAATIQSWIQTRRTNPNIDLRNEMDNFITRLGIDLDKLSAVHVAGTKGKGSTCAFTESILRHSGWKTGLFTSPHLVSVRERICLNGEPLSPSAFAYYFWQCWDRLQETKTAEYPDMPSYFRFLTLLAFQVFAEEQVDVAVIETGVGGRTDATNVLPRPVACAVTALGYDHMNVLGDTLGEIAFEKAGIFKAHVPAFTVEQLPEAHDVLHHRAAELLGECRLQVLSPRNSFLDSLPLGLAGTHQRQNAAVAVALARQWRLRSHGPLTITPESLAKPMDAAEAEGLTNCRWLGRSQRESWENQWVYLDGAHTAESTLVCGEWFRSAVPAEAEKVLVFNCHPSRNPKSLLSPLLSSEFSHVFFCSNETLTPHILLDKRLERKKTISWQEEEAQVWRSLSSVPVEVCPSIPAVMDSLRSLSQRSQKPLHILVTGSLYLVGGWLETLRPELCDKF